ncbi:hypothetical protein OROGR_030751 [Orobanche gracilis]
MAYAIKSTKPLVSVLRMTDSEKMPGVGFIYGSMDSTKEAIAKALGGEEASYKEIWDIIDKKWEFQMHRHLHAAAYYLSPHYPYEADVSTHPEIKLGLFTCLAKLFPDPKVQEKIDLQMDHFHLQKGLFGFAAAKSTTKRRSPVDWWIQYGNETPELTTFAVKVLSLICSSSACEHNWSTFNQLHTKKRNRLHTKTLNKLVFVMYNKRLKSRWLKKTSLKEDDDPLLLDEIPSDDEWMVDENGSNNSGSVLTDNIGDEVVEADGQDSEHVHEVNVDGGRVRVGGRTRGRGRGRDKGKRLQLLDEEDEIEFIESDDPQEDDAMVELFDDVDYDDDNGGGNISGFDPFFKQLDTDDPLLNLS